MKTFLSHRMREIVRPILPIFRAHKWSLLSGLAFLLIVDLLELFIPRIIKKAVDALTNGTASARFLLTCGMIIAGIALLIAIFRYIWRILIFGHARKVEESLRNQLYGHLQQLSIPYFHRTKTGDLMAHAVNDIEAVRIACGMGLVSLTDGLFMGIAAIGFMLAINVKLTLIALIPMPGIILIGRVFSQRIHTRFKSVQSIFSDITEKVREAFAGIRIIKTYTREDWQHKRLDAAGQEYISANMSLARSIGLFFPAMVLFTNVSLAIVVWFGGSLTILGKTTTGDFVAFMSYLNLLAWPMMAMGWVITLVQRGAASMSRINAILSEQPEIVDHADAFHPEAISGFIEVRNLTFCHQERSQPALAEISLILNKGSVVALVGGTGAGKTTLIELLPRLLDPPAKTIFLDGVDIRNISLKILRGNIGLVPQESFLLSESIRENLTLNAEGFSDKSLYEALAKVDFIEDVQSFPDGLDTMVGEKGLTLSGGQRQRLTIARAILLDPPILLLDDALSSVDTQTEKRILDRLLPGRRDKITVIASHRVSTMKRADCVVVLKEGRIAEQGTHAALMVQGGEYARLYRRQVLAEELEEDA